MKVEKVSYAGEPERILSEPFDCVWVQFLSRKEPAPLSSPVLQWVDWKLQGRLSRFLLEKTSKKTTFVPTSRRLNTPLIALEPPGEIDWKAFASNCEGLKARQVLILCEESDAIFSLEKEVRRQSLAGVEKVVLGSDGPAGKT